MSIEIERKFLVKNDHFKRDSHETKHIKQGYLIKASRLPFRSQLHFHG